MAILDRESTMTNSSLLILHSTSVLLASSGSSKSFSGKVFNEDLQMALVGLQPTDASAKLLLGTLLNKKTPSRGHAKGALPLLRLGRMCDVFETVASDPGFLALPWQEQAALLGATARINSLSPLEEGVITLIVVPREVADVIARQGIFPTRMTIDFFQRSISEQGKAVSKLSIFATMGLDLTTLKVVPPQKRSLESKETKGTTSVGEPPAKKANDEKKKRRALEKKKKRETEKKNEEEKKRKRANEKTDEKTVEKTDESSPTVKTPEHSAPSSPLSRHPGNPQDDVDLCAKFEAGL